jgi:aryl-alcohol dehydrogenase-like predicted oxidoreductase
MAASALKCRGPRSHLYSSAVSAAIPGARTTEQLAQNVAAPNGTNGTGLSSDALDQIASIEGKLSE